jgi:hypothetical protein
MYRRRTLFIMIAACAADTSTIARQLRVPDRIVTQASHARTMFVFVAQKVFSTIVMGPMSIDEMDVMDRLVGSNDDDQTAWVAAHETPVAPWISQMFDSAIAVVDIMAQGYAAFVCANFALYLEE